MGLTTFDGGSHSFKCLQRQIEVQSVGPSEALVLAERLVDTERLNADSVEVMHLATVNSNTQGNIRSRPVSMHGIASRDDLTAAWIDSRHCFSSRWFPIQSSEPSVRELAILVPFMSASSRSRTA
jgi:hypothetical protein